MRLTITFLFIGLGFWTYVEMTHQQAMVSIFFFFNLHTYIYLKDAFGNNIGLYRDDGLVLLDTKSRRLSDQARKDLTLVWCTGSGSY